MRDLTRRLVGFDLWFQLHWLFGITAGLVLVVVAVTGGMMSFQQDILEWLNPDQVTRLEHDGPRLDPPALVARYREAHPEHDITSLFWRQDRPSPVIVGYRTPDTTGRRGERAMLDPATGEAMPPLRGFWTFRLIRQIHQRLAAGAIGKFIVGVSTLLLVVLSLSGLWIRWRRRPRHNWRWVWPRALGGKLAGEWHAVLGVWALLIYLVAALTGLWWSFDWYRNGAKAIFASDTPRPSVTLDTPASETDFAAIWQKIAPQTANAQSVFIRLPRAPDAPVEVHYVPGDALHERAGDALYLHPNSATLLATARFDDKTTGDKLLDSVYALHMGAFFGTPGVAIMMVGSFTMPVFFVTGWILYIRRRRMKRQVAPAPRQAGSNASGADALLVAYASQSGLAQRIATQTAAALQAAGQAVRMAGLHELRPSALCAYRRALFVVSTHGEGDAPVIARGFDRQLGSGASASSLARLDYALLSLGDTDYGESFCAFGRRLDCALRTRGARTLLAPIEVDKADPATLADWYRALAGLFGTRARHDAPAFDPWRLVERRILNPGSLGGPTAWLRLEPKQTTARCWQAGDIAEIRPRQAETAVVDWLKTHGLDANLPIRQSGQLRALRCALADRQLPSRAPATLADPQAWFDDLAPLAARDYSIANVADDAIELLVRLARRDGGTGLASGWLIERAAIGDTIHLRLRANPGFRADAASDANPAILIGNGTGLAGLRAHLARRIQQGQHANWLLFGERQQAVDNYFEHEIAHWHATGALAHIDRTFSRDPDDGRHVQLALAEQPARLAAWIERGAHVFVCGSHEGMAPGVSRVLIDTLGADRVNQLESQQRIRMDVY